MMTPCARDDGWDGDGLRLHVLGTGSQGNASAVETPDGIVLIDCGLTCRQVTLRMAALGLAPEDVRAILVTHEHVDHIAGLRVTVKRLRVPVFASEGTRASEKWPAGVDAEPLRAGVAVTIAGVRVTPFHVPHDAAETLGFRLERGDDAIGYCTDMGSVTDEAGERLRDATVLAIESNHDPAMLRAYPGYPAALKARIGGDGGHLSNVQAANALPSLVTSATRCVVGMHISQHTNDPHTCHDALARGLAPAPGTPMLLVAGQRTPLSVARAS